MQAALLPDRGVVKVAGDDARKFLNGLVTSDVSQVTPEQLNAPLDGIYIRVFFLYANKQTLSSFTDYFNIDYLMARKPSKHTYFIIVTMSIKPARLIMSLLPCVENGSSMPFMLLAFE